MIALPVCRWREDYCQDQYICRSSRFVNTPTLIRGEQCRSCPYADMEAPPPSRRPLPCVHLGTQLDGGLAGAARGNGSVVAGDAGAPHVGARHDCALHGSCLPGVSRKPVPSERCCSTCTDYLLREPGWPSSSQMLTLAEKHLASVPPYPEGPFQGRGIVMAGGGERFFPGLYITVRALRHFGCQLPIQVWYLGGAHEMPAKHKAILAALGVECVDADEVRRSQPARRLGGWELKVFAVLHAPYEEVLSLDADCYPCRNPAFLFDLDDYRTRGAIFWPDILTFDPRLKWPAFGVPNPRRPGTVESGQFVLNKRLCWRPLNLTWFYNDHSDYYYRYGFGDKHTFEVAWTRCGQPFVMWETKAKWLEVAYLQSGPDALPLFVHRCADKFRLGEHNYNTPQARALPEYHSALPLERECWRWLMELAQRLGHPEVRGTDEVLSQPPAGKPRAGRFALASWYGRDGAALGERTSQLMKAYAKRHGYNVSVATARIDFSRPASWTKLLVIERVLEASPAGAWLLWMDADIVLANSKRRLEELVDDNVDLILGADAETGRINLGVFLIRNTPAALAMIRWAYGKAQHSLQPLGERRAFADAVRDCADSLNTRIVTRRLFNCSTNDYRKGDFVVHAAGTTVVEKLASVQRIVGARVQSAPRRLPPPQASPVDLIRALLPRAKQQSHAPQQPGRSTAKKKRTVLPPLFCISCWQTPERTRAAMHHFRARRLHVQFFPGIHGPSFGLRSTMQTESDFQLSFGEIGCLLSHYALWQTLAYLPHEEFLILEDDAWFEPAFRKRFRQAYDELPSDWQFVFVGSTMTAGKPIERLSRRVAKIHYPCGFHAYLVKRAVIPYLLQTNHQARLPIDLQIAANSFPALKCYTFTPALVKQRSECGLVDGTGENWPSTIRDRSVGPRG